MKELDARVMGRRVVGASVGGVSLMSSSGTCTGHQASPPVGVRHPFLPSQPLTARKVTMISRILEPGVLRGYATVASPSSSRLRAKNPLGLDHFVQRQRAIALWKDILRNIASIQNESVKKDMRDFARAEFEQHRNVTDLAHIRYLISVRQFMNRH